MTLLRLILLFTPHLEYITDKRNHPSEAPAIGDSSIRLIFQPTVPERRCHRFLTRVARQMAQLLHDDEPEVKEVEQKPHGPELAPSHYSNDVVRVWMGRTGPKITITASHWKRVSQTVLLQATPRLITMIRNKAILRANWWPNHIPTWREDEDDRSGHQEPTRATREDRASSS